MLTYRAWDTANITRYSEEPTTSQVVWMVIGYAMCGPVFLIVGIFSSFHFWCVAKNVTTIEGWEKDKVATLVLQGKIAPTPFPFDLGPVRNLLAVFGINPLLWCLPRRMQGTGLEYAIARGLGT